MPALCGAVAPLQGSDGSGGLTPVRAWFFLIPEVFLCCLMARCFCLFAGLVNHVPGEASCSKVAGCACQRGAHGGQRFSPGAHRVIVPSKSCGADPEHGKRSGGFAYPVRNSSTEQPLGHGAAEPPPPTMERPPSPAPTAGQGGRGLPGNGKMLFQTKPINRQLGQGWGGTRPGWGCLGSTRGYPSPNSATKIQRGEAVVAAPLRQNLLWSQPLPRTPEHQLRTALGPGMPLPSWGTGQGQGVLLRGWPCWPLPWATLPSEPWPHRTPRMRLSP